jgi:hypothetical protein
MVTPLSGIPSGRVASTPTGGAMPPRSVALAADLEKARKQLSDTVNCASSKTPEGKQKVEELSAKVSAIKERIEQTKQDAPPRADAGGGERAGHGSGDMVAPTAGDHAAPARRPMPTSLGGFVDLYA